MISEADAERLFAELLRTGGARPGLAAVAAAEAVTIDEVWVNARRVDIELRADGEQWRVAYFVDDEELVESVDSWRRPPVYDGAEPGLAIIVNGPSGAGKSSLMRAVVDIDPRPWVLFDEPWLGAVRQPYLIWPDRAPRLHVGFLAGIAALASAGNLVLVSAAGGSAEGVGEAFRDVPTLLVGLHCSVETLRRRELGREGRRGGLAEGSQGDHDGWHYDLTFDTERASPDHLARLVLDAVPH